MKGAEEFVLDEEIPLLMVQCVALYLLLDAYLLLLCPFFFLLLLLLFCALATHTHNTFHFYLFIFVLFSSGFLGGSQLTGDFTGQLNKAVFFFFFKAKREIAIGKQSK